MFTGIVEATGTVLAIEPGAPGTGDGTATLRIQAGPIVSDLPPGGSLAVDGVCLTRADHLGSADTGSHTMKSSPAQSPAAHSSAAHGQFLADVMGETLARTTLGGLQPGATVNLERCLPANGRLDGHVVQGHVDATGTIAQRVDHGAWETMRILIPQEVAPLIAQKGAIAVDGVSLTVSAVSEPDDQAPWFEVGLIPATLAATGLGQKVEGSPVNVEADVMAKYAARLAAFVGKDSD